MTATGFQSCVLDYEWGDIVSYEETMFLPKRFWGECSPRLFL